MKLSENAKAQIAKISDHKLKTSLELMLKTSSSNLASENTIAEFEKITKTLDALEQRGFTEDHLTFTRNSFFLTTFQEAQAEYDKGYKSNPFLANLDKNEALEQIQEKQADINQQKENLTTMLNIFGSDSDKDIKNQILQFERSLNYSSLELVDMKEAYQRLHEPAEYEKNKEINEKTREVYRALIDIAEKQLGIVENDFLSKSEILEEKLKINARQFDLVEIGQKLYSGQHKNPEIEAQFQQEKEALQKEKEVLLKEQTSLKEAETKKETAKHEVKNKQPETKKAEKEPNKKSSPLDKLGSKLQKIGNYIEKAVIRTNKDGSQKVTNFNYLVGGAISGLGNLIAGTNNKTKEPTKENEGKKVRFADQLEGKREDVKISQEQEQDVKGQYTKGHLQEKQANINNPEGPSIPGG